MKTMIFKKMILAVAAGVLTLPACIRENDNHYGGGEKSVPVEIRLGAITRGSMPEERFDARDNAVASLRVLIYDSKSGSLKWNFHYVGTALDDAFKTGGTKNDPATQEKTLDILTGTYDFVFVANETSDTSEGDLTAALAALTPGESEIDDLRTMTFDGSAFDREKPIPMVSHYPNVAVSRIDEDEEPGQVTYTDPFSGETVTPTPVFRVSLRRTGIRLRLSITLDAGQYAAWKKIDRAEGHNIGIAGIPDGAYLLPNIANANGNTPPTVAGDYTPFEAADTGKPGVVAGNDTDGYTVTYGGIILPEVLFTPTDDKDKALVLSMYIGDALKSAPVSIDLDDDPNNWGYTLPGNTFLDLGVSVRPDTNELQIEVLDWEPVIFTPDI